MELKSSTNNLKKDLQGNENNDINKSFENKEKPMKELEVDDSIYCLTFICMINEIRETGEFDYLIDDYFFKCTFLYFSQLLIIYFIYQSSFKSDTFVEPTFDNMIIRILCCNLFHISSY